MTSIEVTTFSTISTVNGKARVIDHTPDEEEFQLELMPDTKIIFKSSDVGINPVTVTSIILNDTPWLQAYKVKCTSNRLFKIRPAHGILAPNEKKEIEITFTSKKVPPDDLHFISFYHVHVDKDITNFTPRQMFENFKPDGVKRIQVQFRNLDGTPIQRTEIKEENVATKPSLGGLFGFGKTSKTNKNEKGDKKKKEGKGDEKKKMKK